MTARLFKVWKFQGKSPEQHGVGAPEEQIEERFAWNWTVLTETSAGANLRIPIAALLRVRPLFSPSRKLFSTPGWATENNKEKSKAWTVKGSPALIRSPFN